MWFEHFVLLCLGSHPSHDCLYNDILEYKWHSIKDLWMVKFDIPWILHQWHGYVIPLWWFDKLWSKLLRSRNEKSHWITCSDWNIDWWFVKWCEWGCNLFRLKTCSFSVKQHLHYLKSLTSLVISKGSTSWKVIWVYSIETYPKTNEFSCLFFNQVCFNLVHKSFLNIHLR